MRQVHKYAYPSSTRASIEGLRHYTLAGDIHGQRLPSVTTVLGQTQTKDKTNSLARWRDKVGHEEARRITQEAAPRRS